MPPVIEGAVAEATSLKDLGNAEYAKGNVVQAVEKYISGLKILAPQLSPSTLEGVVAGVGLSVANAGSPAGASDICALATILLSNGSQALYDGKQFAQSAVWAQCGYDVVDAALRNTETNWGEEAVGRSAANRAKVLFRLVRALNAEGSHFRAFILLHHLLLPLLQSTEARATLGSVPSSIHSAMRLSNLHDGFSLVHSEGGGMSTVATRKIIAEEVIFEERQLDLPKLKASDTAKELTTTTALVGFYAAQIVSVVRANDVGAWNDVVHSMAGSWPRTLSEMHPSIVDSAMDVVRTLTASSLRGSDRPTEPRESTFTVVDKSAKAIVVSDTEIAHLALICRYNCFHSGFFRVCALANHSCDPNAAMKYVASQRKVVMVAVKDIHPGDAITVKYFADLEYMMGVGRRRELLYKSWLFWCDCSRCARDMGVGVGVGDVSTLTHESVKCKQCSGGGYVYLPTPGLEEKADAKLPTSGVCTHCGATVTYEGDEWKHNLKTLAEAVETVIAIVQSGAEVAVVKAAVSSALVVVRPIVHSDHWSTRIILYCFCLYLHANVSRSFEAVARKMASVAEAATEYLLPMDIDVAQDIHPRLTGPNGGDCMACVVDLWRRIEPFYPPSQGWALHTIVCKLACFNLMLQGSPVRSVADHLLSTDGCLELLAHHGHLCGQQETATYYRVLTAVRASEAPNAWSAQTHKQLKKVLKA